MWLVDDVAEAALGPWGLLIGVGVGAAVLARKRLTPAAEGALAEGSQAGERARAWLNRQESFDRVRGVAASAGSLAVVERVRATAAEVGDWWSDLYAEAHAEWQAGRSANNTNGSTASMSASGEPTVAEATKRLEKAGRRRQSRPRGSSGRFVKQPEAETSTPEAETSTPEAQA